MKAFSPRQLLFVLVLAGVVLVIVSLRLWG